MSRITQNPAGSVWRRWDLHIHAPGTKLSNSYGDPLDDGVWERYVDALEQSPVDVFGITDYFSCGTYFELLNRFKAKYPDSSKVFFPNVEFRLAESISRDGGHPHIHLVFDNDDSIANPDKLNRFFTDLQIQSSDGGNARLRCIDLTTEAEFQSATVTLDGLIEALRQTFGDTTPYLIGFPANNDGLRSTDTNSPRKVALADRIDRTCNFFFGNASNREFCLKTDRYAEGDSVPKAVVSGSDAHSFDDLERLKGHSADAPPTWIKADATFAGLKQIEYEPDNRVWIGTEPEVLVRQRQDGPKFLSALHIDQVPGYNEANGSWFKGVRLPLNPELVAIIGNKGSGKSALVDILGLVGNSRQESYFSFLTDNPKSKKFRQRGFAENFVGGVVWATGKSSERTLNLRCDLDEPEAVRYLPQNYFEKLTNELEIESFRHEIEEVVFSHVDETDKLGKASFAELEEARTLQCKEEISHLKKRLRELNISIVRLEEQESPSFRKQIASQLASKKDELAALDRAEPAAVEAPNAETDLQRELTSKVEKQSGLLATLRSRLAEANSDLGTYKKSLHTARTLRDRLTALSTKVQSEIRVIGEALESLGLVTAEVIEFRTNQASVNEVITTIENKIAELESDNKVEFKAHNDLTKLFTIPDLMGACEFIQSDIETLKERLSGPQRNYQDYLERLKAWRDRRDELVGSDTKPKPGTLRALEEQQRFLDGPLAIEIQGRRSARRELVRSIFESKRQVLEFYSKLKQSVETRLRSVRSEGFDIEIDASFVIERGFMRQFLNHVNQRRKGNYRTNQDAQLEIGERLNAVDWNDLGSVVDFCDGVLDRMRTYNGEPLMISDQVHDVKELYDFVYSLDYVSSRYELRLGGKNLNELSPGEKGLLLLIFYLQLDLKSTPLIIDQPEDNLDNDSIFKVLAKCVREAKSRRQVVLVTHNPNLAVGADAEQIIFVKLEKALDYKFSYESGAIENPVLNRRIVNVLEGSQPAFVKRRLKYGIR